MKKLFLIFAFVIALYPTSAKSKKAKEQSFEVQKVIEVPGVSKDDLYVLANSACVEMFRNAEAVIQFSDKSAGIIKGRFTISNVFYALFYYDYAVAVTVEVKDGRCRLTLSDITYAPQQIGNVKSKPLPVSQRPKMMEVVQDRLDDFVAEFERKISIVGDSDW